MATRDRTGDEPTPADRPQHRPENAARVLRLLKREDLPAPEPAPRPFVRHAVTAPERPPVERVEPAAPPEPARGPVPDDAMGRALACLGAVARGVAERAEDPDAFVALGPDGGWVVDDDELRARAAECSALVDRVEASGKADAATLRVLTWCRAWCRIFASDLGPHLRLVREVTR